MKILEIGGGEIPHSNANILMELRFTDEFKENNKDKTLIEQNLEYNPLLPFKADTIDMVYCLGTLEHINNPQEVIENIYRVLRYKGNAYFMIPNSFYIMQRIAYFIGIMPSDFVLCHKQHFSHKHFELMLYNSGFKIPLAENWYFYFMPKMLQKSIWVIARKTE